MPSLWAGALLESGEQCSIPHFTCSTRPAPPDVRGRWEPLQSHPPHFRLFFDFFLNLLRPVKVCAFKPLAEEQVVLKDLVYCSFLAKFTKQLVLLKSHASSFPGVNCSKGGTICKVAPTLPASTAKAVI